MDDISTIRVGHPTIFLQLHVWASTEASTELVLQGLVGVRGAERPLQGRPEHEQSHMGCDGIITTAVRKQAPEAGGNWSNPIPGTSLVVPSSCTGSDDQCGRHRHGDTMTRTASTTTVNGTLQFSTVVASSLTIVTGNVTVAAGGT